MKGYIWLGVFVLSCMAPACGDDSDEHGGDSSCGKVAACGGDITGEWTAVDSCVSGSLNFEMCPTATIDLSGVSVSGSTSFKADGTYTSSITASGNVAMTLPHACLSQGGGSAVTCEQLSMSSAGQDPELKCTDASDGACACSVAVKSATNTQSGTYKSTGSSISMTHDGQTEETPYCVSGGDLQILPTSTMSEGGVGFAGAIVFKRK